MTHARDGLEAGRAPEAQAAPEAPPVYRNGYGKPRPVTTAAGTVTVRRPRLRGLEEKFTSRVLPLFARRTQAVGELLPQLYLHGLAAGDFDLALRGLLGEEAALLVAVAALAGGSKVIVSVTAGWRTPPR
jgi:putative transposase